MRLENLVFKFFKKNEYHIKDLTSVKHIDIMSFYKDAGWSSLVARRAHNPKVVGSNPAPATKQEFFTKAL